MNRPCPCCVCVEGALLNIVAWDKKLNVKPDMPVDNGILPTTKASLLGRSSNIIQKKTRSTTSTLCDSTTSSLDSVNENTSAMQKSKLQIPPRSIRLSMDGRLNELPLTCNVSFIPEPLHLKRTASMDSFDADVNTVGYDWDVETNTARPKSMSTIESLHAGMRRRCSLTEYNHEWSSQQEEMPPPSPPTPSIVHEGPRRPRMQRRCSVTKFSLEDTLEQVQQFEKASSRLVELSSISQGSFLVKDANEVDIPPLIATPESKRTFKARLPWGRAA